MTEVKVKNKIYVQSSGFSNKHGYDWQYCDNAIIDASSSPYTNIPGLKQAELNSFCLILSRSSNGLFLLVSGLPSGRKDIRHRDIRNTVMWSIDEPVDNDEAIFRNLAALTIRDRCGSSKLTDRIKHAIDDSKDKNYGYTVNFELLKPEELTKGLEKQLSTATLSTKKLSYSEQNLEDLARELEKSLLPTGENNLIVVTDNRTQVIVGKHKLYLSVGDVILEQSMNELLTSENDKSSNLLSELSKFFQSITRISPKLALFTIGAIASSGIFLWQNFGISRQLIPTINIKKIDITTVLTGTSNSPEIEKIKLLDSDKKEIAIGIIDSTNNWTIAYKLGSKIDCQNQLSIQGFNKGGEKVGESIAIYSLCNDSQSK
jgi:hypothetical protein